jgi:hypothetical protein
MRGCWPWLKHEWHAVPPPIFFLITFHIVVLERRLMLREYGLPLASITGATVAALLIAKVIRIGRRIGRTVRPGPVGRRELEDAMPS